MSPLVFDTRGLERLASRAPEQSRKAAMAAFRAVTFRMKVSAVERFLRGVGSAPKNMTVFEEATPTTRALSALAKAIAYTFETQGDAQLARVGLGSAADRARRDPAARRRQFEALVKGGVHTVKTHKEQGFIAQKMRRRLLGGGYNAIFARGSYSGRKARRLAKTYVGTLDLPVPRQGTSMVWPSRNFPVELAGEKRSEVQADFRRLYAAALRGERWAGAYWA